MLELPPQLGFYVQIVVFFAFAWILMPLILRPTLDVLARRAEKTSGAQAQAIAMREEVTAMGEAFEKSLTDARRSGATGGDGVASRARAVAGRRAGGERGGVARLMLPPRADAGDVDAASV